MADCSAAKPQLTSSEEHSEEDLNLPWQIISRRQKLPNYQRAGLLNSFLSKLGLPMFRIKEKKKKKGTKTAPRRHCLLWFYYFSILCLFQTNLVRCRCINLLSFFFFRLNNSVTSFVQTSMVWLQAPKHPSCKLLLRDVNVRVPPKSELPLPSWSPPGSHTC